MTKEQSKIVEENEKLIYGYAHHKGLDLEEWQGLLSIELCKVVMTHNPEQGELSTYYYSCCDNLVRQHWRDSIAIKRTHNGMYPLIEEINSVGVGIDNEELTEKMLLEDLLRQIDDFQDRKIVKLRYEGYNQEEISEFIGMSQPQISRVLTRIKEDYFGG